MIGSSSTVTVAPAPVPQTGQRTVSGTGDDGALQMGIEWDAATRFTDNGDGTVLDKLTGLIWLKQANCFGSRAWTPALSDSAGLQAGSCGLTDGSADLDWRLPNVRELLTLVDYGEYSPALPASHAFSGVQTSFYWTSTTVDYASSCAWAVDLFEGDPSVTDKAHTCYVWPVCGEGITAFYRYLPLVMERGVVGLR